MMIKPVDKVEILTLQDNYIDMIEASANEMISRVGVATVKEFKDSVIAEHGFSALIKVTEGARTRSILFDFGFSNWGVAHNMKVLGVNASDIEVMALSHGHADHFGGFAEAAKLVDKPVDLVVHPRALDTVRYFKMSETARIDFPLFKRADVEAAGVNVVEAVEPRPLLDGGALFLGAVPRETAFEKGVPVAFYKDEQGEHWDPLEDDTALVFDVKGKGLVVLSGCAHSGIINTVNYAKKLTGVDKVHAVMGGFHLGGPVGQIVTPPTVAALKEINPDYVIPCHCTGRAAITTMEKELPGFILSMAGTTLRFTAA